MRIVAVSALLCSLAVASGCGEDADRGREIYMQGCAACHGVGPQAQTPVVAAPNLFTTPLTVEQVRRAVIDGRPGMPAGLVGGDDVDEVARWIVDQQA